jgi:acetylornithine deacetylase/succinyl-diaminopimelate desuccinylase-like protein
MTVGKSLFPASIILFLVAACGQDQAPVAEPGVEAPAAEPTASVLLPHQELARELLKELIEIDTTDSVGDNTAAAQAMANRLLAAGFPAEDVHVLAPVARKGNLVARYRGRDSGREPLLLLAHIDVVEADPADWTLPPFTFIEEDGYYYARGTTDDKD